MTEQQTKLLADVKVALGACILKHGDFTPEDLTVIGLALLKFSVGLLRTSCPNAPLDLLYETVRDSHEEMGEVADEIRARSLYPTV